MLNDLSRFSRVNQSNWDCCRFTGIARHGTLWQPVSSFSVVSLSSSLAKGRSQTTRGLRWFEHRWLDLISTIICSSFDINLTFCLTSRICFARPRRSDWSRCCSGPPPHPRVDLDNTTSRRKTSLRLGREMVLVWCWWNRETGHKMSQDVTSFANETLTGNSCSLGSTLHLAAEMKLPHVYEHCKRLVAKCVKTWTTLVQWDLGPWLECSYAYQNVRRLAKDRNSRLKVESWVSMVVMWCRCILVCSVAHSALLDKANGLAKEEWTSGRKKVVWHFKTILKCLWASSETCSNEILTDSDP